MNIFIHISLFLHEVFVLIVWSWIRNEDVVSKKKCYIITGVGFVIECCCMMHIIVNMNREERKEVYRNVLVQEGVLMVFVVIGVVVLCYMRRHSEGGYLEEEKGNEERMYIEENDVKTQIELLTSGFSKSYEE